MNGARSALKRHVLPLAERLVGSIKRFEGVGDKFGLTFDDGPAPEHLPAILDVLDAHRARATFFVIAHRARRHPALLHRIAERGHEIALHGLDHLPVPLLTSKHARRRIAQGRAVVESITGQRLRFYRPPYGEQSPRTYLIARSAGLEVVGWTALCDDWLEQPVSAIAEIAASRLEPGGILVLHDHVEPDLRDPKPAPTFDRAAMVDAVLTRLAHSGLRGDSIGRLRAEATTRKTLWFWS